MAGLSSKKMYMQFLGKCISFSFIFFIRTIVEKVNLFVGVRNVDEADKEVTSISMKFYNSDDYYLLGRKDFDKYKMTTPIDPEKVYFRNFVSEVELLKEFLRVWMYNYPDIVTGWNCIPQNSYIWTTDSIKQLKNINIGDILYDSEVVNISPKAIKKI